MLKEAFDVYFFKLFEYWKNKANIFPKVPYSEDIDTNLIIPGTLNKGYIQWQPKLQNNNCASLRIEGVNINPQIIEYFTTYWFLFLSGMFNDIEIDLRIIPSNFDINKLVNECYELGKANFTDDVYFELGSACVDEDDSFLIYVNNSTGEVFCVEFNTGKKVHIASSIYDLLIDLEV